MVLSHVLSKFIPIKLPLASKAGLPELPPVV